MGDSSEDSLCATTIRHSGGGWNLVPGPYPQSSSDGKSAAIFMFRGAGGSRTGHYPENSPNDTAIVIPAKERHPVPRYGAGIQFPAPAISLGATERPSSFSCFVVSVATDMRDSSENIPRPISRRGDSRIAPTAIFIIRGVGGNRPAGAQRAGRNPSVCPVHRTLHEGRRLFTRYPGIGLEHIVTARGPC